jgi:hypothetical protein
MNRIKDTIQGISGNTGMPPYVFILLIIVLIAGTVTALTYAIKYGLYAYSTLSSAPNVSSLVNSQILALTSQYAYLSNNIKTLNLWKDSSGNNIPANQQLLINASYTGCRLAGYLGPFNDGVFNADAGVVSQLSTGARLFIIEIDMDENGDPIIVYRNASGYIRSMNSIKIKEIAKAFFDRAYSNLSNTIPSTVTQTGLPLILVLYFNKVPDIVKKPKDYITFLGKVSKDLQILQPHILALTAQGDFRRQGLDSQMFFMPKSIFNKKIIVLCNVDTTILRNATNYGVENLTPEKDLDLLVNARIYNQESGSSFGASSAVSGTTPPAAIVAKPGYFINMPTENRSQSIDITKKVFTIVMDPDPEVAIKKPELDSLLTDYGVHCVPFSHFVSMKILDPYYGPGSIFENKCVITKSQQLRFIPPVPIVTQQPPRALDTRGGYLALSNV